MGDTVSVLSEWPSDGLESIGSCPVCGSISRQVLHGNLRDHAFGVAPGSWTLWRCAECNCGYLDPRPSKASIGLAYAAYYTHDHAEHAPDESGFARLRRRIAEAYLNRRYGTDYPDALPGGDRLAALFPRSRAFLDISYARQLQQAKSRGSRLLDVGCGNGSFVQFATRMGWEAEGIDPDPAAVAAARALGCRVSEGSLDDLLRRNGTFEHVTLSHVLEHVHEPATLLRQCFALLAPGGRLWLETPNLDSVGHTTFGSAWRGLEPPRHLVLFNQHALQMLLQDSGFERVRFCLHPGVSEYMWNQSRDIARRLEDAGARHLSNVMASPVGRWVAEFYPLLSPASSEFLTCTAFRPVPT